MNLGQFAVFAKILGLGKAVSTVAGGPNGVDDTASLQAIINTIVGNPGKGLKIPDGRYKISAPLNIGVDNSSIVTGIKIEGSSRGGVIIEQMTNNVPIFNVTGQFVHSCHFKTMTLLYTNQQSTDNGGNCFKVNGPGGGSFYNSTFEDITATKFYYFMDCPTVTWWGNIYNDMWFGAFSGGINRISAVAGEPRCTFRNLYITGELATNTLFRHTAMTALYDNIEINNCVNGVPILADVSGGTHVISHLALEGATYATGTTQLFEVSNSRLIADYIYLTALVLNAGAVVYAFHPQGGKSIAHIKVLELAFSSNNGQFYCFNSQGPIPSMLGEVTGLNPAGGSTLCDIGGSVAANFMYVQRWNEMSRIAYKGDADASLLYDDPATQVLDIPTTAIRTVTLPQATAVASTAMFSGRRFKFVRTAASTGGFAWNINDSSAVQQATLAAGQSVEFVWQRSGAGTNFKWVKVG